MSTCAACRFFKPSSASPERYGDCRRYAPRPEYMATTGNVWPILDTDEWCGKFSPRDLPPMPPGAIEVRTDPAAEFVEWLKTHIRLCDHGYTFITCGPCMAPWLPR